MRIILVVMAMVFIFTTVKTSQFKAQAGAYEQQTQELLAAVEDARAEQEAIERKKTYLSSNSYIEDLAREKFGLIYENEIKFKRK